MAAIVFLEINGFQVEASHEELEELVPGVARGLIDKEEVGDFFRQNAGPLDSQ